MILYLLFGKKSLCIKTNAVYKNMVQQGTSTFNGDISNFQVMSCVYGPSLIESSVSEVNNYFVKYLYIHFFKLLKTFKWQVVRQMSIQVEGTYPNEDDILVNAQISDTFIRLTAGTVQLLQKLFGSNKVSTPSSFQINTLKNYSDVWKPKNIDAQNFWFLKPGMTSCYTTERNAKIA